MFAFVLVWTLSSFNYYPDIYKNMCYNGTNQCSLKNNTDDQVIYMNDKYIFTNKGIYIQSDNTVILTK